MRALLVLTVAMGVLIVIGTATIAVTIVHRMSAAPPHALGAVLDEPQGTRIIGAAGYGERLAVVLQGGGPDRVVLVDPATGKTLGHVTLAK